MTELDEQNEGQLPTDLEISTEIVEKMHATIAEGCLDLNDDDVAYVLFDRTESPQVVKKVGGDATEEVDNSYERSRQRSIQVSRSISLTGSVNDLQR